MRTLRNFILGRGEGLATARTRFAAVPVWGHAADVFCEAISHFMRKVQVESVAFSGDLVEGEVGEAGHAVFDLNWERLCW